MCFFPSLPVFWTLYLGPMTYRVGCWKTKRPGRRRWRRQTNKQTNKERLKKKSLPFLHFFSFAPRSPLPPPFFPHLTYPNIHHPVTTQDRMAPSPGPKQRFRPLYRKKFSLPTHQCPETEKRYVLWRDIRRACEDIDHVVDHSGERVMFMIGKDGELYVFIYHTGDE